MRSTALCIAPSARGICAFGVSSARKVIAQHIMARTSTSTALWSARPRMPQLGHRLVFQHPLKPIRCARIMETNMKRREIIWLLGSVAANLPLAALAQPSGKVPTIGFLGSGTPSSQRDVAAAFAQRLRELGWSDGNNVAIAYRWAEGRSASYAEIAAEFVQLNVDVIVSSGAAAVAAAKSATSTIPVVFSVVNDPLGTGVVSSLARPGGNV